MCCCFRIYNSSQGYTASTCHMPGAGSWLLCWSVSTLYPFLSSTPFFLLSLSFSPLLALLSSNIWRRQIAKNWEPKETVLILAMAALSGGTGQRPSRAGSEAAGCQELASQACLHYQALSEPSLGRTLQSRGNSSEHPVCSVGNHIALPRGVGMRKPREQSKWQLSPCR